MRYFLILTALSPILAAQELQPDISKLSGKQIYDQFCSRCHAADGSGEIDQDMIDGMEAPPPDFRDGYFSSKEKRTDWETVISHGGGARGLSMSMPAWGEVLSPNQVTEVVEYVKSFVDQSRFPQGETNFLRSHLVSKAFVEQECLILPTITNGPIGVERELMLYYANRFGDRFQYEIKAPLLNSTMPGGRDFDIGDIDFGLKYCFYDDYLDRQIVSVGVEAGIPTEKYRWTWRDWSPTVSGFLAAGALVSKNVEAQASAQIEHGRSSDFSLSMALTLLTSDSKQGIFPGIESRYLYEIGTGAVHLYVFPKVYWGITKRGHVAFSLGPEIIVVGEDHYNTRWRMFLLWDYADGSIW